MILILSIFKPEQQALLAAFRELDPHIIPTRRGTLNNPLPPLLKSDRIPCNWEVGMTAKEQATTGSKSKIRRHPIASLQSKINKKATVSTLQGEVKQIKDLMMSMQSSQQARSPVSSWAASPMPPPSAQPQQARQPVSPWADSPTPAPLSQAPLHPPEPPASCFYTRPSRSLAPSRWQEPPPSAQAHHDGLMWAQPPAQLQGTTQENYPGEDQRAMTPCLEIDRAIDLIDSINRFNFDFDRSIRNPARSI